MFCDRLKNQALKLVEELDFMFILILLENKPRNVKYENYIIVNYLFSIFILFIQLLIFIILFLFLAPIWSKYQAPIFAEEIIFFLIII